ncbi:YlcI/YnfO family protein [Salmonella enterica subsp. enterica serovar Paratyphi A]
MATGSPNNKSQQLNARSPHDVVAELESNLEDGETKAQINVTAVKGEIKRRQRRKNKPEQVS